MASLSAALSGGNPTAPADASLALMLGAARRESRTSLRTAAIAAPAATTQTTGTTTVTEAERMTPSGAGRLVSDKSASARQAIVLSGRGAATTTLTIPDAAALTVRVRAAAGAPNMTLSIDGVPYTTLMVTATSYTDYTFAGGLESGPHVVSISSTTATTRNLLYVDKVTTSSGPIIEDFSGKSGSAPGRIWTARTGSQFDLSAASYSSGNVFLDGQGHMVIQATRGKGGNYTSGWVWTKNSLSFGYGTVTARVKVPKGQGLWPAVWMIGADSDTLGWPASGEIDMAELPSTTTTVYSTLHGPISGGGDEQAQFASQLPDLSTDYHNFWVTHLPDEIIIGVDGETLGTFTPDDLTPDETWVYNRPMYFIMNLAVGGPWAGAPDSTTPSTAKMMVESVRFDPI